MPAHPMLPSALPLEHGLKTVRSASFALFCVLVMAAIVVPAARAQKTATDARSRDVRTIAQQKINKRVLAAIFHRRGDAQGRVVPVDGSRIQVDRHGRALVDVRASVQPGLQKKIKALGGIVVTTSQTYDSIVGWVPLQSLERLAADPSVRAIEPGL